MAPFNKTGFVFSFVCAILFASLLIDSAIASETTADYDSVIVIPKVKINRLDRTMHSRGILRYKKVKENIYVIPLEAGNGTAKVAELKASGLFDLVEPDYKFSLDQVNEKKYTKIIIHSSEQNPPESNTNNIQPAPSVEAKEITPNDKGFNAQYYLRETNATKAWSTTVGSSLLVGVLDTGVDENHPDLVGKVVNDSDSSSDDLTDQIGHGTEVSGIIAANTNNNQGIAGISWNTMIFPVRVTDESGQARVSTVVSALDKAYSKGVKIVQISLSTNQFSQVLKDAVAQAQARGILVVSTSGNSGANELRYPAAFDGVIGVGAVNQSREIESYSTTGEHVALVAPGSSIYTTSLSSGYAAVSGTSFAAPQVAGAAALIWSVAPNLNSSEVRDILIKSAIDLGEAGKDPVYGYGLLNTEAAVEIAKTRQANRTAY
ncbi:MAG: S8 family serine peptidase [Candidatus Melainabacteria bacterium]|nr:S8 family serine peptidase [Candidatus Melainabacteria bacterium]